MTTSLRNVTKKIKRKKVAVHPNSRRAKMLTKATLRQEKVVQTKIRHQLKSDNETMVETFLREYICTKELASHESFTVEELQSMMETFIARNDEELQQLKDSRRPGRPAAKRQDLLQMNRNQEYHLFQTGWKVADLTDPENVKQFRGWKGDMGGLNAIKKIEIKPATDIKSAIEI